MIWPNEFSTHETAWHMNQARTVNSKSRNNKTEVIDRILTGIFFVNGGGPLDVGVPPDMSATRDLYKI